MPELNYDKMVKAIKSNPDITQAAIAEAQNLSLGQVSMMKFCQAKVEAGVYSKAPGTSKSVKNLRDNEENRWELIAARTGKSVAAVKALYDEAGGDSAGSYVGRGRNFTNGSSKKTSARSGSKTAAAGRGASKKAAAGKKTAAKKAAAKKSTAKKAAVARNRTGRRSSATNPS